MTRTSMTKEENCPDFLDNLTAADLMTSNPVSIRGGASVGEATVLFSDRGFSGAAVIDEAGRPIGVVSSTDLLIHDREKADCVSICTSDNYGQELPERVEKGGLQVGYQVVDVDRTTVNSVMTPVVFSVTPETSARKVVKELLALRVHRLFVVDRAGVLVGVVSTLDVLKSLLK
jgi:CBS-domain-containing membrane protein